MSGSLLLLDARGMRCPWPVLRLSRAARLMEAPGAIRILADDPLAAKEIAQLCAERGWTFAPAGESEEVFDVLVG